MWCRGDPEFGGKVTTRRRGVRAKRRLTSVHAHTSPSVLEALERSGTSATDAINGTLRVLGVALIVAAAVVMTLRHQLVRRGQIAPLSMKASVVPRSR
jgi:hypothetical protein